MACMEPGVEDTVDVIVDRVMFRSDDGVFSVVRVRREDDGGRFVAVGKFPLHLEEGDFLQVSGHLEEHARFGTRFVIQSAHPRLPASVEGIRRYLKSGRVKGIGPKLAERLVACFGADTLRILEDEPDRVREVPGVGRQRLEELKRAFADGKQQREALVFLQGLGLGPALSGEIWRTLGADTLGKVSKEPYSLCAEIDGVGFTTADRIAQAIGIARDAPERLEAGLQHVLDGALDQGHVCCPAPVLVERAAEVLEVDRDQARRSLRDSIESGALLGEVPASDPSDDGTPRVYLPVMRAAEEEVARRLCALRDAEGPSRSVQGSGWDRAGSTVLTPEQSDAVGLLLRSKVGLLTGGPGVGKTTVLRTVVGAYRDAGLRVALASPTGRAARRLAEATGVEAQTLHRLFGIVPGAPAGGKLLGEDVLVIDETSMLDLPLFVLVLRRLPASTTLLLVGDPDQLPSVGPGSLLKDIIGSARFPVAHLTKVFRQSADSDIILNAHRINRGELPVFPQQGESGDCFFVVRDDPEEGADMIRRLFCERIPERFGIDPRSGIQVLCPMHRGAAGTESINRLLQETLSAGAQGLEHRGRWLYVGDRVMQSKNDYDLEVMNGDLGQVVSLDPTAPSVDVVFDGRRVTFAKEKLDRLETAFAVTVHKSQGGEFPAVVMPLFGEHYMMLRRNVLYTAVTRARRLLVLVGNRRALHRAVTDDRMTRRAGELERRLRGETMAALGPDDARWEAP